MKTTSRTSLSPRLAALACAMLALLGATAPSLHAATLLFDFGADASQTTNPTDGLYWNNVTHTIGSSDTGTLTNLVTSTNAATGINLEMISSFTPVVANTAGTTSSTLFPGTATGDSLFANVGTGNYMGYSNLTPAFKLTGLDVNLTYDFVFYASRIGASNNREAEYRVTGISTSSGYLDPVGNVDGFVSVTGITPNASGEILIELFRGPNNATSSQYYVHLGVMTVTSVPEPSVTLLAGAGVFALVATRRRR